MLVELVGIYARSVTAGVTAVLSNDFYVPK